MRAQPDSPGNCWGNCCSAKSQIRFTKKGPTAKRYDVFWVGLDPVEGCGLSKTRRCVIVSLDALNARLSTVVVCPLTSTLRPAWRTRSTISMAGRTPDICIDQILVVSIILLYCGAGIAACAASRHPACCQGEISGREGRMLHRLEGCVTWMDKVVLARRA